MFDTENPPPDQPVRMVKKKIGKPSRRKIALSASGSVIELARGDYLKKYAPDSDFNTTKEGRIVRDAISVRAPKIDGKVQSRSAVEAMTKADIKIDISGKHSEHRKRISGIESEVDRDAGQKRSLGLEREAKETKIAGARKIADAERDYADSYLGKKKAAYDPTSGTAAQNKRAKRVFKKAPQKIMSPADKVSVMADRAKFSSAAAQELRQNANVLRGARRAAGPKAQANVAGANAKFAPVIPGLKKMIREKVDQTMKSDPARLAAIKHVVNRKAEAAMKGRIKDADKLKGRVSEITKPLFTPGKIGGESATYDKGAIADKLKISEKQVDAIKGKVEKLTTHTASRRSELANRVIKEGKVFDPIRSAANATHEYPVLKRNVARLGRIGKAAVVGAAATTAIDTVLHKKKKPEQVALSDGSAIISLGLKLSKVGQTLASKRAVKRAMPALMERGIIEHGVVKDGYSFKEQAANMEGAFKRASAERDAAVKAAGGVEDPKGHIEALERKIKEMRTTQRSGAATAAAESLKLKQSHIAEMDEFKARFHRARNDLVGDFKIARSNDRRMAKRIGIATTATAGAGGVAVGRASKDDEERRFSAGDAILRATTAAQNAAWRGGRAVKAAARKVVRRFPVTQAMAKGAATGAMIPIPGAATTGAITGAISHVLKRRPSAIEGRVNSLIDKVHGKQSIRLSARDDDRNAAIASTAKMGISAGVTSAATGLVLGLAKTHASAGRKPAGVLARSTLALAGKNAGKWGAIGAATGVGAATIGNAILGTPRKDEGAAYTKRGALGGVIGGGILGAVGAVMATRNKGAAKFIAKHAGEGWRPMKALQNSGTVGRAAIGAGAGAAFAGAHLADEGQQVDTFNSTQKKKRTIMFEEPRLTGKIGPDKYRKKIQDDDLDRRDSNIGRAVVAGGALGALIAKRSALGATIGAGAGAASVIGIRQATSKGKDIYGDRSRAGKQAESLPWKAGIIGAGIIGAQKIAKRVKVDHMGVYFDSVELPNGEMVYLATREELERSDLSKWDRKGYAERRGDEFINRAGRAGRLVRDVKIAATGGDNLDERGRKRTPEYKKPWVKKAIGVGLAAIAIRKGRQTVRGLKEAAAVQKATTGSTHGLPGLFDDATRNVSGSALKKTIREHRTISRPILQARREVKNTIRDTKDVLNDKVDVALQRWRGTTPEIDAAKATVQKSAATEDVKKRLRAVRSVNPGVKPPTLTQLGSKLDGVLQFAITVDDWDIEHRSRNSAVIRVPGAQKRVRRQKGWDETAEGQRTIRNVAIGTAGAGGFIGSRIVDRKIADAKAAGAAAGFKDVPGTHLKVSTSKVADEAAVKAAAKTRFAATGAKLRANARKLRV